MSDEQKASNRQKSGIRARIEHVFGSMSRPVKASDLRYLWRRRNAAAIGLNNLTYNLGRYQSLRKYVH